MNVRRAVRSWPVVVLVTERVGGLQMFWPDQWVSWVTVVEGWIWDGLRGVRVGAARVVVRRVERRGRRVVVVSILDFVGFVLVVELR